MCEGPDGAGGSGDEALLRALDDLEQQADGLHLADRDAQVAELTAAEYAEVGIADRLHGSVGSEVTLWLVAGDRVQGRVSRAGEGWVLVDAGGTQVLVVAAAISRARGLPARVLPESSRPTLARLGMGSVLRQIAGDREEVSVRLTDGTLVRGSVRRVGADFLELTDLSQSGDAVGGVDVLPFRALVSVRR